MGHVENYIVLPPPPLHTTHPWHPRKWAIFTQVARSTGCTTHMKHPRKDKMTFSSRGAETHVVSEVPKDAFLFGPILPDKPELPYSWEQIASDSSRSPGGTPADRLCAPFVHCSHPPITQASPHWRPPEDRARIPTTATASFEITDGGKMGGDNAFHSPPLFMFLGT